MDFVISKAEDMVLSNSIEVPVVSAICIDDDIISLETNQVEENDIAWMHAEFLAVTDACAKLKTRYLDNASIYVNLEPCSFCASILEKVRIKDIYFGAYDLKCGAIDNGIRLFDRSMIKPNIIGGIQEQRCSDIIKIFFERIRKYGCKT